VSQLLTLYITPVIYLYLEKLTGSKGEKRALEVASAMASESVQA